MKIMVTLCLILWFCTSCSFEDEPGVCPYNVRIEYRYAGAPGSVQLPLYVDEIHQFVFDTDGVLVGSWLLHRDSLSYWKGQLPDGHYTVVAWGNRKDGNSRIIPEPKVGVTSLKELLLSSYQATQRVNTERLYYGSHSLDVGGGNSSYALVYMTHCHAVLRLTFQWVGEEPPVAATNGGFTVQLRGIPSEYSFGTAYDISLPDGTGAFTFPDIGGKLMTYKIRAGMNYDNEVNTEVISYRFTSMTHPILSLYNGTQRIMKEIDLETHFRKLSTLMDENTEQEFDLLIRIEGNKVTVTEISGTDWDEGGGLG